MSLSAAFGCFVLSLPCPSHTLLTSKTIWVLIQLFHPFFCGDTFFNHLIFEPKPFSALICYELTLLTPSSGGHPFLRPSILMVKGPTRTDRSKGSSPDSLQPLYDCRDGKVPANLA